MKICIISHEYEPFPGGGIATYHNAAAKHLAQAGHEIHVVTNNNWYGHTEPHLTQRLWHEGNLTIHRLSLIDEGRNAVSDARFFDLNPAQYSGRNHLWVMDGSNFAAHRIAAYVEMLHNEIGLDVIECPEYFAEAFYIIRQRRAGQRHAYPPVCTHGHTSSRLAFGTNEHMWELGYYRHRQMMLREEYCIQHADALLTPSRSLMNKYRDQFGDNLPSLQKVLPYFLDVTTVATTLPPGLDDRHPYLVSVGRIETRKGSDLALQAFSQIADEHPDLQLVFLGKENWHEGESFDDVIAAHIPSRHRSRILRLGNVTREQAMATMRDAVAFIHPAPWDNYPCAVLEAMGLGATCIVADDGGHAEMIEDGKSGLVHPAGDSQAMADTIKRVLNDPPLKAELSREAQQRVKDLTEPENLVREKIALFSAMVEAEKDIVNQRLAHDLPGKFTENFQPPTLPGCGVIILDAGGADAETITATAQSLVNELQGNSAWEVKVLKDYGQEVKVPAHWAQKTTLAPPPWLATPEDHHLVYIKAGVRFDAGALFDLVQQIEESPTPCGSFLWLRPASARVFPYPSDFSWNSLLMCGHTLPPAFAVRAGHLRPCNSFSGLFKPEYRLSTLLAIAANSAELRFQHTGQVQGDFYGDLTLVDEDIQTRALGYLDNLGLIEAGTFTLGNLEIPEKSPIQVISGGQEQTGLTIDPAHLANLEKSHHQYQALKQMKIARFFRKLGIFNFLRKLFPKAKQGLGPGNHD